MILPRKKLLVAVAIGIVLGGGPVVAFNYWLGTLLAHESDEHVVADAHRAIGIVDGRLDRVMSNLADLARRGVDSCTPDHLEALRRAGFLTAAAKAFAVIASDGAVLCTNHGAPSGQRTVLTSGPVAGPDGFFLDIVQLGTVPLPFVRLRRVLDNGNSLAALVPVELLLPLTAGQGGPFVSSARLTARDGTLIAEGGTPITDAARAGGVLTAQARSARFGIAATAELPRGRSDPLSRNLWAIGSVVDGVIAAAGLMAGWLLLRRSASHPMAEAERALADDEFIAYYQPIVDITSARLLGAEVLVRWRKPDGSVVSPGAFVPLLEQGGLIMEMTRQLMRRVCAEAGPAYAARPHLQISFNLTAAHFADDQVVGDIREIFAESPIRLSQVILELTERQPLHSLTATRRVIAALQGLGCRIALDDVGTGHSGLSSMLRLGVDIIKIDKMFIDSISSERNSATIIETLVDLARNMRMHVVAEGVENFDQVADLRARGIRAAQGYVFAPPLPGSSFLGLLEAIDPLPAATRPGSSPMRLRSA